MVWRTGTVRQGVYGEVMVLGFGDLVVEGRIRGGWEGGGGLTMGCPTLSWSE